MLKTKRTLLFYLILFAGLTSCLQTENSSNQDEGLYADVSQNFTLAKAVLVQNCSNCHSYHLMSETELVDYGLVIPGDYLNSEIYYRISNSEGALGPKNMPLGSNLSGSEMNIIKDWITNI